jgi:hypothetical protein
VQRVWIRAAAVIALAVATLTLPALNSASSALVIQVNPESHLDTPLASLFFQVNNPGEIVYSQPVTITAWVRALPNREIHLTAQPQSLTGPSGAAPPASLTWTAAMTNPTGGAAAASCIAGDFSNSGPQQLIANWTRSGIARCTVTFALATNATWAAGAYSGAVSLTLAAK